MIASITEMKLARAERLCGLFDKANGKTQASLARYCKVTPPAVALWVKNGAFTYDNAVKIANYFGVNPEWLFSGQGDKNAIPALHEVATVADRYAILDIETRRGNEWIKMNQTTPVAISQDFLGEQAVFAETCRLIRVQGDRMSPTIQPGEWLLINEAEKQITSSLVYAVSVNGEFVLAQLFRVANGYRLRYANPNYPDEELSNEMMNQVSIIGRVIMSVRAF